VANCTKRLGTELAALIATTGSALLAVDFARLQRLREKLHPVRFPIRPTTASVCASHARFTERILANEAALASDAQLTLDTGSGVGSVPFACVARARFASSVDTREAAVAVMLVARQAAQTRRSGALDTAEERRAQGIQRRVRVPAQVFRPVPRRGGEVAVVEASEAEVHIVAAEREALVAAASGAFCGAQATRDPRRLGASP
jgi:hypothetical protein